MSDQVEPSSDNKPDYQPTCRCGNTKVTSLGVIDVDGTVMYHCNTCNKDFLPPVA